MANDEIMTVEPEPKYDLGTLIAEWTYESVAYNPILESGHRKISDVILSHPGNYWGKISVYDTSDNLTLELIAIPGTREKDDCGIIINNIAVANESLSFANMQILSVENTECLEEAAETGLYVLAFDGGTGGELTIDPEEGYLKFSIWDRGLPPETVRTTVTVDDLKSATQHYFVEDGITRTLVKISDKVLTASEMAEMGTLTQLGGSYDILSPLGSFTEVPYPIHYFAEGNGAVAFYILFFLSVISVSDTVAAAETMGIEEFPETGTYIEVDFDDLTNETLTFWFDSTPATEESETYSITYTTAHGTAPESKTVVPVEVDSGYSLYNGIRLPNLDPNYEWMILGGDDGSGYPTYELWDDDVDEVLQYLDMLYFAIPLDDTQSVVRAGNYITVHNTVGTSVPAPRVFSYTGDALVDMTEDVFGFIPTVWDDIVGTELVVNKRSNASTSSVIIVRFQQTEVT